MPPPEDIDSWRPVVGTVLLLLAVVDTVALGVREHRIFQLRPDHPPHA